MKLFQYYDEKKKKCVGAVTKNGCFALPEDVTMESLLGRSGAELEIMAESGNRGPLEPKELHFAPIVSHPEKILCVGLNYDEHIDETGLGNSFRPGFPTVFCKFANTLLGSGETLRLPPVAEKFDYEAELVIVMGASCKNVSTEEAERYIAGYTVGNDFSARDLQMATSQWTLGKACDGFAPVGPYLVPGDCIDPNQLDISCRVNGSIVQQSNTKKMIYSCAEIVSYLSQFISLRKGDLIFTGTPAGVILGKPENRQHWLKSGDVVTVEIQNIGVLETKIL